MRVQNSVASAVPTERGVALVEVTRGDCVESVHSLAACVVRESGEALYELGDVEESYPLRSLAKPFLATELIRSKAAQRFDLLPGEIALASGSHDGEQRHIDGVRVFLHKIGLAEDALLCGPATDGNPNIGPPIANNCSGKHAAVLALCRHFEFPTEEYLHEEHPVQQWLLPRLHSAFSRNGSERTLIDGCGLPIFAASLQQIAVAFARYGASPDASTFRVRAAIAANPTLIGGTRGNLDTQLIEATDGAVLGKIGAEGLYGIAIPGARLGFAMKVLDGNSRALGPIVVALLRRFAALPSVFEERLEALAVRELRNASGTPVGVVRALPLP
jgi:L-asparaginase II